MQETNELYDSLFEEIRRYADGADEGVKRDLLMILRRSVIDYLWKLGEFEALISEGTDAGI